MLTATYRSARRSLLHVGERRTHVTERVDHGVHLGIGEQVQPGARSSSARAAGLLSLCRVDHIDQRSRIDARRALAAWKRRSRASASVSRFFQPRARRRRPGKRRGPQRSDQCSSGRTGDQSRSRPCGSLRRHRSRRRCRAWPPAAGPANFRLHSAAPRTERDPCWGTPYRRLRWIILTVRRCHSPVVRATHSRSSDRQPHPHRFTIPAPARSSETATARRCIACAVEGALGAAPSATKVCSLLGSEREGPKFARNGRWMLV
jgi:hypothetical protein